MKQSLMAVLLGCLFVCVSTTSQAESLDAFSNSKGTIKIAGGTAHIPVMKEAAHAIMTKNPEIQITIAGGGTGVGIKQVGEGLVDIGNAGRKPTDEEVRQYDLHLVQWAIDGVAVVVHPENPVKNLGSEQLRDIYSGKIVNWKELGGTDRGINLYDRDETSGTREVFLKNGLKSGEVSKTANVVVSNGAMKTAVAGDPYAIGYVSVGHIDATVGPVALDGVMPSIATVKDGSYKVARGLFSLTKGPATGLTKLFLEYLLTPEGQKIAVNKGFISVK